MAHLLMLLLFSFQLFGYNLLPAESYTLRGRVLAADNREPLSNASVTVGTLNISTVTNQDGYFTLRVPESARNSRLIIRYLGYENLEIPVVTLIDKPNNHIVLQPSFIELGTLEVVSGNGRELIREALNRIPQNYAVDPTMMVAFYRESIKKIPIISRWWRLCWMSTNLPTVPTRLIRQRSISAGRRPTSPRVIPCC